jgi:hypothetical protein
MIGKKPRQWSSFLKKLLRLWREFEFEMDKRFYRKGCQMAYNYCLTQIPRSFIVCLTCATDSSLK